MSLDRLDLGDQVFGCQRATDTECRLTVLVKAGKTKAKTTSATLTVK